jgi:hypothetical protein
MKLTDYPTRIPQLYGTFIALGLMAYFWTAWFFGFIDVPVLRLLNLGIQTTGIYFAYRQFKRTHKGSLNYFRALSVGFMTSLIGTSTFVLFLFILFQMDQQLFQSVIRDEPLRPYLTPYTATFAVWNEGIISGLIGTFVLTNVMDTDYV